MKITRYPFLIALSLLHVVGLKANDNTTLVNTQPSFNNDKVLLETQFTPVVLENLQGKLIVLPELQGRAMVGTFKVAKEDPFHDKSLGWINRRYLQNKHTDPGAAVGGSTRLWFGSEKGPYAIFFAPGKPQTVPNIRVPDAISMDEYKVVRRSASSVHMQATADILNYSKFVFEVDIQRSISLINEGDLLKALSISSLDTVNAFAYEAHTKIKNVGSADWTAKTGMLSIWDLSAFDPSDNNTVVMPIRGSLTEPTAYFNENSTSHYRIMDDIVYYRANAKYMNKIGIPIENTKPVLGSYDSENNLLTIITFSFNPADKYYNNAVWFEDGYEAHKGEAINVFNDGSVDGKPPFGPFYELETSSSARPLKAGETHSHTHKVFHVTGERHTLNQISENLFGVDLATIENVFKD